MMNKLVVEVVEASDLMPKDGEGSASPFVEVKFDEQHHSTETKHKDLNPYWNEKLVFNINNPRDLAHRTIEVVVYNHNDRTHNNFLGRVRISGASIPLSESQASVERYPLEKRGLFSNIRGDIALRCYAVHDHDHTPPSPPQPQQSQDTNPLPPAAAAAAEEQPHHHHHPHPHLDEEEDQDTPLQEINPNMVLDEESVVGNGDKKKKKMKKKEKEVRTFHSIPAAPKFHQAPAPAVETLRRADFAKAGPPNVMSMQIPKQNPDYSLVETMKLTVSFF